MITNNILENMGLDDIEKQLYWNQKKWSEVEKKLTQEAKDYLKV